MMEQPHLILLELSDQCHTLPGEKVGLPQGPIQTV